MKKTRLKMGMVGGGPGAFIGAVHRMAARLDGRFQLVCGAFSSDPQKSKKTGQELGLQPGRVYDDYETMMSKESALPAEERMDVVAIVTPNHLHYPVASAALAAGFHVICDKPLTHSLEDAKRLVKEVEQSGKVFCLTHNYTGYPMVRQARTMVQNGSLGEIRKIVVEYPQGWLSEGLEATGQKQASWRTNPASAGISGCMGDIGSHAENLAEYITGLKITALCADLSTFVEGRKLDDDGNVLLRFEKGAKGILHASQIAVGEENALAIRVYGTKGGLEWHQMEPNTLVVKHADKPEQHYRAGQGYLSAEALEISRIPPGHPEGYLEAFATIYRDVAAHLLDHKPPRFPTVHDGLRGMEFLHALVQNNQQNIKWTELP